MPTKEEKEGTELLWWTLDLLILHNGWAGMRNHVQEERLPGATPKRFKL